MMVGSIAIGNLLGKCGFVERRVIKGDGTGVDRLARSPAISATTALESTPPDRKAPSGTSAIMRSRIDSLSFSLSCAQASSSGYTVSRLKRRSQYSWGDANRQATTDRQGVRRRQFPGLTENRSRLRDVTEREILLDRQRINVARQATMGQQ
jgi:hypothetical protein